MSYEIFEIYDDFLIKEEYERLKEYYEESKERLRNGYCWHTYQEPDKVGEIILDKFKAGPGLQMVQPPALARCICFEDQQAGYEIWSNLHAPSWHLDKDEDLYHQENILNFPNFSIVYYLHVGEDLKGGELCTEDITVKPKTNRLIAFSKGILHKVNEFEGERVAISINPWMKIPLAYR